MATVMSTLHAPEAVAAEYRPPPPASIDEVPIVDLAGLPDASASDRAARQIGEAARSLGFFYVTQHGIPESVVDGAFAASRRFFDAPEETRTAILRNAANRGYFPLGSIRQKDKAPYLVDSFDMGIEFEPGDPYLALGLPSVGFNQWPRLENFRAPVAAYFDAVMALGMRLLPPLARSLALEDDFFVQRYSVPRCQLRLLHYPQPERFEGQWGIGARPHTDYGLLTLLAQDPGGGLELQRPDGQWVCAPHIPGTLIVNLGDLAARWTNDLYRSSPHRVVNGLGRDRYSMAFFFNPEHRTVIETLPSCVSPERPARYAPVVAGDYMASLHDKNRVAAS